MFVNKEIIEDKKNVRGLIKHDNVEFFASDNFYPASRVKLSNLAFSDIDKKDVKEKLDEKECSDKNAFGIYSMSGDLVRRSR